MALRCQLPPLIFGDRRALTRHASGSALARGL
jgi:hypothetical protein